MIEQPSIEVVVQVEEGDVSRANVDIALGRFTLYKWVVFGASSAIFSIIFFVLIFPKIAASPDRWLAILLVGFIGFVGWPAILVAGIHLNAKKAAKSLLQSTPAFQGPIHWTFSESEIRMNGPSASASTEWKTFVRVRETKLQFLFYPQDQIAYAIPKRCFSTEAQVSRFRETVRRQVLAATLLAG